MPAKNQPIYTHNMDLTESEFLRREFSLTLTELTELVEEQIIKSDLFYIATANLFELKDVFEKCKSKSVVIFFFGNETYDIPQYEWLNKYSGKIKFAFIYNLPRRTSFKITVRCLMGAIVDGGLLLWNKERNIFRNFKNGIDLMRRTRKLTIDFPHLDFPQGYSRRFVREIKIAGINIGENSILDQGPISISHKIKRIDFVGQNGSWCRELAIKVLAKKNIGFIPTYTQGWGGANQGVLTTYIDSLIQSELTLNPPGNLTNRTHRYVESLIFNSLPIMPPSTLQDPHLWGVWSESRDSKYFSWKKQINHALKLSLQDRELIILNALLKEKEKVKNINKILNNIDQTINKR
jgi:hypothetical protein